MGPRGVGWEGQKTLLKQSAKAQGKGLRRSQKWGEDDLGLLQKNASEEGKRSKISGKAGPYGL